MDKYKKAADLLMNCVGEGSTIIQLPNTLIPSTLKEAYEVQAYIETPIIRGLAGSSLLLV